MIRISTPVKKDSVGLDEVVNIQYLTIKKYIHRKHLP
jgi:hypothetical protein